MAKEELPEQNQPETPPDVLLARRKFAELIIAGEYDSLVVGFTDKDGKWWVWSDGSEMKALGLCDLLRDYCKAGLYTDDEEGEDEA